MKSKREHLTLRVGGGHFDKFKTFLIRFSVIFRGRGLPKDDVKFWIRYTK